MSRSHAFSCVKFTRRFEKSFRKLAGTARKQCEEALGLLVKAPLSTGLRMKPIRPSNTYYEARTESGDRLVIYPVSDTAYVMDVVCHDDISKWGNEPAPEIVEG